MRNHNFEVGQLVKFKDDETAKAFHQWLTATHIFRIKSVGFEAVLIEPFQEGVVNTARRTIALVGSQVNAIMLVSDVADNAEPEELQPGEIMQLIDFALQTNDREWFDELREKLNKEAVTE